MTPEEHQVEETRQKIVSLVEYLRDLRKTKSLDFALFRLSEIAKDSGMEQSLHDSIKVCVENPEKELKVNFKKNEV